MKHFETRLLNCFVAIADSKSFTRAAEKLHLTQPALSLQLRRLERQIGKSLVSRSSRRVELTDEGQSLLAAAREVVRASEALSSRVERIGEIRHRLKLGGAIYGSKVPERVEFIRSFLVDHPEITLTIESGWQPDLLKALARRSLSAVMIMGLPVSRALFDRQRALQQICEAYFPSDLPRVVLARKTVGLLVPREWPLASAPMAPVPALAGRAVAIPRPNACPALYDPLIQHITAAGGTTIIPPDYHAAAVEQYGVERRIMALCFGWYDNLREGDDMVYLPIEGFEMSTELAILTHPDDNSQLQKTLTHYAEAFIAKWAQVRPRSAKPDLLVRES
jgi:DNA-binding transcriptional LysR family regulator